MFIWKIWGNRVDNLEVLYIKAADFDEAMAIARLQDKRYNSGQVHEVIEKPIYY